MLAMFPEQLPSYLKIRSEDRQQHSKWSILPIRSRTKLWLQFWLWVFLLKKTKQWNLKKDFSPQELCETLTRRKHIFLPFFTKWRRKRFNTWTTVLLIQHMHASQMCSSTCELRTDIACMESLDEWTVSEKRGFGNPRHDKAKQRIAP